MAVHGSESGAPPARRDAAWSALAALVLGACLPLAFAPFGYWPVALLGFAGLVMLCAGRSPRRAFVLGYLAGIGMFGVGVTWIHESFQYNGLHGPVVWLLSGAFVVFLALFPGAWGYLMGRLRVRLDRPVHCVGAAAAIWILVEWVRGWFLTGFTWLQLGYSQSDGPAAPLAALAGTYGIGWLIALSGAALAACLSPGWRSQGRRRVALTLMTALLLGLWTAAQMLRETAWTTPAGPPLSIAAVQGNYPQHLKWRPENLLGTLQRYRNLTEAADGARLVVWPETAIPRLAQQLGDYTAAIGTWARARGITVLIGAPFRDQQLGGFLNSMLAVGAIEGVYHKRHLVPFGEYVPLAPLFLPIMRAMGVPPPGFVPWQAPQSPLGGDGALVIGISICYEAAFGAEIIESLPAATVLVNVSNDAWFGDTLAPHQHLQITRMRAIETGRYLVRATNTGVTALVAPDGQLLGRLPQFEAGVLRGEVTPMQGMTPYARVGDWPVLVGCLLSLGLAVLGRARV